MNIGERIHELREAINHHDRLYYVEARPTISDTEYDALWTELETLEREHPELLTSDSPTQRVSGAPIDGFAKVRHEPPMQSLDKTYKRDDLKDFDHFLKQLLPEERWDYVVEPKVDGLSLSLLYQHGKLIRAATRGNGEVGDDITANVRTIRSIPLTLPCSELPLVEVRGEIYMTREGFAELNRIEEEAGREPFANPRNAAAGSIKLLDPREVAKRPLDAVFYAAGALRGITFSTHTEMMRTFAQWGLRTPPWQRLCMDMEQVMGALDELEAKRHLFPFEMDGAVIKVNQRALYSQLGATAHAPRSARAYKYAPESAQTKLLGITIQVGRTGVLTPVAELEPVPLAGSVIARATLHNEDFLKEITPDEAKKKKKSPRPDIRVGDTVIISKHGDVIPAVDTSVLELRPPEAVPFVFPDRCPVCGGEVIRLEKEVATRCMNPDCPAQRVGHLELFVSRNALDISAIGGRMAEALVQAGLVVQPLDLYRLDVAQLSEFKLLSDEGSETRFGKKAQDMAEALERARTLPLHRWIFALGIPGIGITAARTMAELYEDFASMQETSLLQEVLAFYEAKTRKLDPAADRQLYAGEIITRAMALKEKGLLQRDDPEKTIRDRFMLTVKAEMARAMVHFLASDYARRLFAQMQELGINPRPEVKTASGAALAGKSFVITGTLSQPRETFEALIRAQGGTVASSVSKKTSYLLVGADAGGSKYTKAQALGTPMLSEAAFMELLDAPQALPPERAPLPPEPPKPKADAYIQDDFLGAL